MPSSIDGATIPNSSATQPPLPPMRGVAGSHQHQGAATGGPPGASGATGQIGNFPVPGPTQSSVSEVVSLTLTFDATFDLVLGRLQL